MNTMTSHCDIKTAEENIQPYLNEIAKWTEINELQLNASKSTATLFTTDPGEFNKIYLSP